MKTKEEELIIQGQFQEHSELVQLYMHEDKLAWQLNLAFITMNGVIFTGFYNLKGFETTNMSLIGEFSLILVGIILNLITLFSFFRNDIYIESRLQRCYLIEDQLRDKGIIIQTLTSNERLIEKGKVVHGKEKRILHWWEKVDLLRYRYWAFSFIIFWIGAFVWLYLGRPGLQ